MIYSSSQSFSAVITAADFPSGQGTARALANKNIELIGLHKNPKSVCCQSIYWNKLYKCPENIPGFIKLLQNISLGCINKPVLFPCDDASVLIVSDNREQLSDFYHFVLPDKSVVKTMMDKSLFYQWAKNHYFTVPETHLVNTLEEMKRSAMKIGYPLILKPALKSLDWDRCYPYDKVIKVQHSNDLERIDTAIFNNGSTLIVQKWIPGDDDDVHFCLMYIDKNGNEKGYYTGKKIMQWPVGTGNTAAAVGTNNLDVYKITSNVFKKSSFRGIGSVEFKYNVMDKRYYITEPTVCRNDIQSYLAVSGGVNLSLMAFDDAMNTVTRLKNQKKTKSVFIVEFSFFNALIHNIKTNNLKINSLVGLVTGNKSFAMFNIKDLGPFRFFLTELLGKLFSIHK